MKYFDFEKAVKREKIKSLIRVCVAFGIYEVWVIMGLSLVFIYPMYTMALLGIVWLFSESVRQLEFLRDQYNRNFYRMDFMTTNGGKCIYDCRIWK